MAGSVVDDLAAKLSLDSPSVSWESKVNILKNKHATEEECLEAVVFFRKLLSGETEPPIGALVKIGIVPLLNEIFARFANNERMHFEAAWALTNIASGTSDHTKHLLSAVRVPIDLKYSPITNELAQQQGVHISFIKLMETAPIASELFSQIVWGLGNIAGDSVVYRDLILAFQNVVPTLLSALEHTMTSSVPTARNIIWTLSNLCRGPNLHYQSIRNVYLVFLDFIALPGADELSLIDACWGISYVTDGTPPQEAIQIFSENFHYVETLLKLTQGSIKLAVPALRAIGNLITTDDAKLIDGMLDRNLIDIVHNILVNPASPSEFKKETCWLLSNLTAGTVAQVKAVVDHAELFEQLIIHLNTATFNIRKEIVWVIANATNGGAPESIIKLVEYGSIPSLLELAQSPDRRVQNICLEALDNMLTVGDVVSEEGNLLYNPFALQIVELDGIQKLKECSDTCPLAITILDKFYGESYDLYLARKRGLITKSARNY